MRDGIPNRRPQDLNSAQPYRRAALEYIRKGWLYPLPLPERKKSSPPTGFHGWTRPVPSDDQIQEWLKTRGKGNICLRLNENVVGIDVDDYGEKNGLDQLGKLVDRLGPLPATYRSSAREGLSGIRFFRVPDGMLQWHNVAKYIDIICWGIRYAVVYPSWHPEGGQYVWYDPNGNELSGISNIPAVCALPELPDSWIDYLTNSKTRYVQTPYDEKSTDVDIKRWAKANLPRAQDGMWTSSDGRCSRMDKYLATAKKNQEETHNVHDTMRDAHWSILQAAVEGCCGWDSAFVEFSNHQLSLIAAGSTDDRDINSYKAEWSRSFIGAIRKIKQAHEDSTKEISHGCGCVEKTVDIDLDIDGLKACVSESHHEYDRNDRGNAAHVRDIYGKHLHYLKGPGQWLTWDGEKWSIDDDHSVVTSAFHKISDLQKDMARNMFTAALNLGDITQNGSDAKRMHQNATKWVEWARTTGETRRIKTSMEALSVLGDIPIDADLVNSDRFLLGLPDGYVMVLKKSGFTVRKRKLTDLITMQTSVMYQDYEKTPYSGRKLWEGYLNHAVPDPDVRRHLQILAGCSLVGDNHQNLCVFLYGTTKTGKSTFLDGFLGSLGDYARPVNIDMFRQGERNPSLFHAMQMRVITASELSGNNVFHPDVFKNITGGDPVPCRLLFSNNVILLKPAFTPWIGTNDAMTMNNADAGVEQRICAVPFDVQNLDSDNDPSIKRAIATSPDVWSAILSWAVRGYDMYLENGLARSTWPQKVIDSSRDFFLSTNELGQFLQAKTVRAPIGLHLHEDWRVTFSDMHSAYTAYCYEAGEKPLTENMFSRRMRAQGYNAVDRKINGKNRKVYLGFRLRDGDGPVFTIMKNSEESSK